MLSIQLILILLFSVSLILPTIGAYILNLEIRKFYPEEHYFRMSPPKRLIEKLKIDHSENKELIKKIRIGVLLENLGMIGIIFFFSLMILSSIYLK